MTTNMQAKPSKATMSKNTTSSEPALCRFYFQNQQCRYGSSCRFSHEAPKEGMTRVEILSMIPCPYYARGVCSYGDDCELLHQQQQNHEGGPTKFSLYNRKHKSKKKVEEEEEVIDTTCGICLENVYNTQHKQFGLLSCCNHIFCHTCLMEWRCRSSEISSSSRRVCPTCREPSNYVIPSHTFPTNPSQKLDIVQNYKQKCSTIPCRKFVNGKLGSCPFGRDCFYAHQDESGVDVKDRDKTMQELFEERERHRNRNRRNNRDSDLDMIAETLMMMALQRQFLRGERRPRRGQAIDDDDDDGDDASFGIDDMLLQLLSMGNSGDEDGLPLPMHQLFAAMGAFDGDENDSFNDGSDDDDSMPPLEDLDDNSMPPLEDLDDNSMPPLEDLDDNSMPPLEDSDDNSMPPLEEIE